MTNSRRTILRMMGRATVGGALFTTWPGTALRALTPPTVDENLPDTSTYETFQHPEAEDLDYIHDLYEKADRLTAETRSALPHHLNLAYGAHVRQRLDLYLPGTVRDSPVLLFFHGGGFEEGHRAHYGFIASPYAARGIITAVAGYRLVPDGFHYPAQLDDVKQTLIWIHKSIARYGGNPNALFLSGHSAGALMVAEAGADRTWMSTAGLPTSALRGMAPVSGNYDLTASSPNGAGVAGYYAPTPELRDKASPLRHIRDPVLAAVVAQGQGQEYERHLTQYSPDFVRALQERGVDATLLVLPKATHIDTVFALATESSPLLRTVAAMIDKHSA